MNMKLYITLKYNFPISLNTHPEAELPGHMVPQEITSSICNLLRNLHTVFHSGYTNLHSYQQCTCVPFTPYPCQYISSIVFLLIAILTCVMNYHIVVLIYFYWKDHPFLIIHSWPFCIKLIDHICMFISGLCNLFHWSVSLFLCQYHTILITIAL